MRHFLTLRDYERSEIIEILKLAIAIKKDHKAGKISDLMHRKTLGMIFEKNSTRTRVGFETGIYQLGGMGIFLSNKDIQLSRGESIADTARVISSMVDMVMIRTFEHERLEEFAKYSYVPLINGLSDLYHPLQVMADYLTMIECGIFNKGSFEDFAHKQDPRVVYIGDGNNMTHSWLVLAAKMGFELHIACPKEYLPNSEVLEFAKSISTHKIKIFEDPREAIKDCNVVVTDTWISMGQEEEKEARKRAFREYCIDASIMALADKEAIFLHCLPAYRGQEVSAEVLEGKQSRVFQEAENRLHVQKGIMVWLEQSKKKS
ncbi:ornithine carbamoyltransferase [Helicobacter mustelae]|uniref:Ornithine carbamoyltransferase, catabolic n=1 Tax=Helicobacter mustelae (strain ATCC 43772 / CCUG 25715 / CIP 103759 / LMG 18044 / NCTC 12198 / R85-136P) TaxID=679897 RepID=D3UID1_HELM1|nr:ornithine carbamoyltransferase [Helicobacter mustelae]CBG40254.1 ornithine carbamoyltransferase [Helicobacter mustelae 12198]SQH71753.1 ornithine carbamoyltransferase [Helicobacter mustelae]STP12882.1 ornithine carbamoyltransferase [Helicobacter mustelae]